MVVFTGGEQVPILTELSCTEFTTIILSSYLGNIPSMQMRGVTGLDACKSLPYLPKTTELTTTLP